MARKKSIEQSQDETKDNDNSKREVEQLGIPYKENSSTNKIPIDTRKDASSHNNYETTGVELSKVKESSLNTSEQKTDADKSIPYDSIESLEGGNPSSENTDHADENTQEANSSAIDENPTLGDKQVVPDKQEAENNQPVSSDETHEQSGDNNCLPGLSPNGTIEFKEEPTITDEAYGRTESTTVSNQTQEGSEVEQITQTQSKGTNDSADKQGHSSNIETNNSEQTNGDTPQVENTEVKPTEVIINNLDSAYFYYSIPYENLSTYLSTGLIGYVCPEIYGNFREIDNLNDNVYGLLLQASEFDDATCENANNISVRIALSRQELLSLTQVHENVYLYPFPLPISRIIEILSTNKKHKITNTDYEGVGLVWPEVKIQPKSHSHFLKDTNVKLESNYELKERILNTVSDYNAYLGSLAMTSAIKKIFESSFPNALSEGAILYSQSAKLQFLPCSKEKELPNFSRLILAETEVLDLRSLNKTELQTIFKKSNQSVSNYVLQSLWNNAIMASNENHSLGYLVRIYEVLFGSGASMEQSLKALALNIKEDNIVRICSSLWLAAITGKHKGYKQLSSFYTLADGTKSAIKLPHTSPLISHAYSVVFQQTPAENSISLPISEIISASDETISKVGNSILRMKVISKIISPWYELLQSAFTSNPFNNL